jgi:hypothetical protein
LFITARQKRETSRAQASWPGRCWAIALDAHRSKGIIKRNLVIA